jgi:hypothetical protein
MFKKDSKEYKMIAKLDTPEKIQTFLESIPFNHEKKGETCMSAARVLRERTAHCIEGAFVACAALMHMGERPLIVSLKVEEPDDDHIIIPFKKNGYYGALSKTNHPVLQYRDPVYRSQRELVMSYFHEYFLYKNGKKTLLGYTRPINLNRYGKKWLTAEQDLWDIAEKIYDAPIISVVPKKNKNLLRKATAFEIKALSTQEWK